VSCEAAAGARRSLQPYHTPVAGPQTTNVWPARHVPGRPRLTLGCGAESFHITPEAAIFSSDVTGIVDEYVVEDEPLLQARANAERVGGSVPVTPLTGTVLRFLAAAINARSVVEIGTGCGTSGIWLLRGMRAGSVLTSVDTEPEHHRLARSAFQAAGFGSGRYRLITGRALEVLPRLADSAYDLVFCDADKREYPEYLTAALRLLRPGGIVAFDNAVHADEGPNVAHRDPDTPSLGELRELVFTGEDLVPMLLPTGDGLLAAVKRAS
jgi:predicted O-methyltransferase YrrM